MNPALFGGRCGRRCGFGGEGFHRQANAAFLVGIPILFDTPLHLMIGAQPDLGYALVLGATFGITGGAFKAMTPR